MTITDHLTNEAALADQLRAERLRSAGLEERVASLEATIAGLSAGFAAKMATALEAMETRTAERIAEWIEGYGAELVDPSIAANAIRAGKWRPGTCGDLVAFADGELPTDRATAFREHLQICGTCATALPETMMVAARLSELKR